MDMNQLISIDEFLIYSGGSFLMSTSENGDVFIHLEFLDSMVSGVVYSQEIASSGRLEVAMEIDRLVRKLHRASPFLNRTVLHK